jgi:hypothetical protein
MAAFSEQSSWTRGLAGGTEAIERHESQWKRCMRAVEAVEAVEARMEDSKCTSGAIPVDVPVDNGGVTTVLWYGYGDTAMPPCETVAGTAA